MSSRDYKAKYEGKKHLDISVLLETLFELQLQKASHYKRDKKMRQGNITAHGYHLCRTHLYRTNLISQSTILMTSALL